MGLSLLFGINNPYNYDPFKAYISTSNETAQMGQPVIQRATLPIVTGVLDGRVFAGGNWHEIGQSIGEFQLYNISSSTVTFKYKDKIIAVPIGQGGRIVQVKEKE
jgi:hypothetical protein